MTATLAPASDAIPRTERSLAPDIARGMMLLFIALANVPSYLYGRPATAYGTIADGSTLDRLLLAAEQLVIAERSRPMFAILYGFGMAMMASRLVARRTAHGEGTAAAARGVRRLLARRSLWLMAFGALHSSLLFMGDILAMYGVTGLLALFFVTRPDRSVKRWLAGTLVGLLLVGMPLFALLMTYDPADAGTPMEAWGGTTYASHVVEGLADSITMQILAGISFFFVPLVATGVLLHRAEWITDPGGHLRALRRTALVGGAVGVASAAPMTLIALGAWAPGPGVTTAAIWLTTTGGMAGGLGYVCIFALLAHRLRAYGRRGPVRAIAALGERSLTGYLLQSVMFAPVLSAWGLGFGEGLGYAAAFGLALAVWAVTVGVAVALDARGARGPFEAVLRRLTYGKSGARRAAQLAPVASASLQ